VHSFHDESRLTNHEIEYSKAAKKIKGILGLGDEAGSRRFVQLLAGKNQPLRCFGGGCQCLFEILYPFLVGDRGKDQISATCNEANPTESVSTSFLLGKVGGVCSRTGS